MLLTVFHPAVDQACFHTASVSASVFLIVSPLGIAKKVFITGRVSVLLKAKMLTSSAKKGDASSLTALEISGEMRLSTDSSSFEELSVSRLKYGRFPSDTKSFEDVATRITPTAARMEAKRILLALVRSVLSIALGTISRPSQFESWDWLRFRRRCDLGDIGEVGLALFILCVV